MNGILFWSFVQMYPSPNENSLSMDRSTVLLISLYFPLQEPALTRRVERLCDTVVKLESFVGSENETNPVYKDYHGKWLQLFHKYKLQTK